MSETYVTLRGVVTEHKPYGQYTAMERHEILEYYVKHGRSETMKKYGLTNQTMGHLIYHGKATIEAIEDANFAEAGI